MEYSKLDGFERVPLGFQKGHRVIFFIGKCLLLFVGFFFLPRVKIIGKEKLKKTLANRSQGKKVILDFDHFSSMDIPLPLIFIWWSGYGKILNKMFFLIGYRWSEKLLVRPANRAYIFPPSEAKKIPKMEKGGTFADRATKWGKRVETINYEVGVAVQTLEKKFSEDCILWLATQGSRMRSGVIECKPSPGALALVQKADWLTPIALEGTFEILPPGKVFPRFWHRLTIIVGEPVLCSSIRSAEELGMLRARLHYEHGRKEMAGYYLKYLDPAVGVEKEREEIAV